MRLSGILAMLLTLAPLPAAAQLCDGQGTDGTVSVSTSGLAFGTYDPSAGALESTVTVTAACDGAGNLPPLTVAISAGNSGGFGAREMTGPGTALVYQLYQDAGHGTVWGDGTGGSGTVSGGNTGAARQDFTGYATLGGGQFTTPGVYNDMLSVIISY